jgi:AcrR family transcriptional regulator
VLTAASPRSARKAKGQGGERREEILEHAQRLFAAHGVQSVSTRRLAEAVGISQPSLYAYFPSRSDLLDEVCARAFARLQATAEAAISDPGDPVETMIRAYIRFGLEQPDAYRIAFMLEGLYDHAHKDDPEDSPGLAPGVDAFGMLRRIMAARLGPSHPDLETASQSLWASMHGLVSLLLAREGFPWIERQRLIDWHVAALMKGLP